MLGVIRALQEWRCYLEGGKHPVTLTTDHNPLVFLRSQLTLSRRQGRWVEYLERFDHIWKYIPGRTNVADPLSRNPILSALRVHTKEALAEQTPSTQTLCEKIQMGYLEDVWFTNKLNTNKLTLDKKGLWRLGAKRPTARIVVPQVDTVLLAILKEAHDSIAAGHHGPKRTLEILSRWFGWEGMAEYVTKYCSNCLSSQQMKPSQLKPAGLLKPSQIPMYPWQSISMDFITCLPVTAQGNDTLAV